MIHPIAHRFVRSEKSFALSTKGLAAVVTGKTIMNANKPRKAVLFPGALGDFICLLPALNKLAGGANLDVFAKPEFADIVSQDIRVCSLERYEINRLFVAGAAAEPRVRDFFKPYLSVYSWTASAQPVFAAALAEVAGGAARLFAFNGPDPAMHQADYYLSCLGLSQNSPRALDIPPRSDALLWSEEFWNRNDLHGKRTLVIAPGSGAAEKNWPLAYFMDVGRWWRQRTRGAVIVLLGPVERERGGFETSADDFIYGRNLSLAQIVTLLRRGDLYLGNDSGVTHLAAGVGLPTAALFGPSAARRWAPRGPRVRLLSRNVGCSPCAIDVRKNCPHRKCLTEFLPQKVIDELEKFVELPP